MCTYSKSILKPQNHQSLKIMKTDINGNSLINGPAGDKPVSPRTTKKPFLIGVTGGTASGKTSVCEDIISQVKRDPELQSASVAIMSQDIFYVELNQTQMEQAHQGNFNFDHPNAFDFDLFEEILRKLADGDGTVQVPTYSYKTHSRTGWEDFHNADVIIVEGILVLYHKAIRDMFEMKIFVDCDSDTRLARRVFRDIEERGRSVENVLHQYCEHVKPAFEEFCRPTKKYVDVILPRGRENTVAVNLIAQHIHDLLTGSYASRIRRTSMIPIKNNAVEGIKMTVPQKVVSDDILINDQQVVKKTTEVHSRPH